MRNSIFLHLPSNIIRMIIFGRLRWAGRIARMDEGRKAFEILTRKPTVRRPLGRLGIDGGQY